MATTLLTYPCPNCNQKVRVKAPLKGGIYKITCPHCQYKANLKLPGLDTIGQNQGAPAGSAPAGSAPATPPAAPPAAPKGGPAVPPPFQQKPAPRPADPRQVQMPPANPGINVCNAKPEDNAPQKTLVVNKPNMPLGNNAAPMGPAKLERIGTMFNDSYPLRPGIMTIGRYDDMMQSDIAIKGDTFMSRRSVSIDMRCSGMQGFTYSFRVLSSTNPVLLNGRNVPVGTEVFLNFGDTFTLGRTKFRLNKA